jgi:transposase
VERLEKKVIKGHTYYYYSCWERVNGKSRRLWQKYLGKLEDIVKRVEGAGPVPAAAEVFDFGLPAALWKACGETHLIHQVDACCPKRNQGLSVGEYIALAAMNWASHPLSKKAMGEWFFKSRWVQGFPQVSRATLASQRFWDHRDRLSPETALMIWRNLITAVVKSEAIKISSICYDGTNFYTFIDTFNSRCLLAKRGKNKQGRSNLRQINYALFCSAGEQIPLYYEVYEGNRNDTQQFPVMIERFHHFIKASFDWKIHAAQITLIFDKGNRPVRK